MEPSRTFRNLPPEATPAHVGSLRNLPQPTSGTYTSTRRNSPEPSSGTPSCDPRPHTPELIWAEDPSSLRCWGKSRQNHQPNLSAITLPYTANPSLSIQVAGLFDLHLLGSNGRSGTEKWQANILGKQQSKPLTKQPSVNCAEDHPDLPVNVVVSQGKVAEIGGVVLGKMFRTQNAKVLDNFSSPHNLVRS